MAKPKYFNSVFQVSFGLYLEQFNTNIINRVHKHNIMCHGAVRQVVRQKDTFVRLLSMYSNIFREEVKLKTG